jgi:hypothetical protein
MKTFAVRAHWDADAAVWWADSDDIPGLTIEAGTLAKLEDDVLAIAPELLKLNLGFDETFKVDWIKEPA